MVLLSHYFSSCQKRPHAHWAVTFLVRSDPNLYPFFPLCFIPLGLTSFPRAQINHTRWAHALNALLPRAKTVPNLQRARLARAQICMACRPFEITESSSLRSASLGVTMRMRNTTPFGTGVHAPHACNPRRVPSEPSSQGSDHI